MRCSKFGFAAFAPRPSLQAASSSACLLRSSLRLRAEPLSCAGVTSSLYMIGERCEPPGVGVRFSVHTLRAPFGESSPDGAGRLGLPRRCGCIQRQNMYTTRHKQVPRVFSSRKFV